MSFARRAWNLLVAIKDGLVLIFMLLFFGLLYAFLSVEPNSATISNGALLLKLNGVVVEEKTEVDPFAVLTGATIPVNEFRQRDLITAIKAAKEDDRVKALVLDLDRFFGGGQTSLSSIGEALADFKKSDKPIYSFATAYGDDAYQLAVHADEIWVDPMGGVFLTGPGGTRLYYKTLIDKLGINAHIYRVGTYKSAVEPYMRSDQSEESRTAIKAVYDALWDQWQDEVLRVRPNEALKEFVNDPATLVEAAKGDMAQLAIDKKIADKIGHREEFERRVAEIAGEDNGDDSKSYRAIDLRDWVAANPADEDGEAIGVVTVAGDIVDGNRGPGVASGERIAKQIRKALKEDDLKALVLRVDSPGGSAMASEQIRQALLEAKAQKLPIVVSMSNLAASGGYWVATAGDHIIAEPSTITGSIGIFAVIPSFENALKKLGVNADGVQTTGLSGQPDLQGGFSDQFNRIAQSSIEQGYTRFLTLVAEARGKTTEEVDKIGQGRVWDGGTARQLGLVDGFGSIDDALAEAAKRAGLEDGGYYAKYLQPEPTLGTALLTSFLPGGDDGAPQDAFSRAAHSQRQLLARAISSAQRLISGTNMQARCLECEALVPSYAAPNISQSAIWAKFLGQ